MKVGEIVEEIFGGSALVGGSAIRGSKAGPETTFWSNFGRRSIGKLIDFDLALTRIWRLEDIILLTGH